MKFKLQPYNLQELGQRQNQEDSMFPALGKSTMNDRLFILCDGMGGHEKGEVASATVCEVMSNTILSRWNPDEPLSDGLLQQAIEEAYDALDAKDNGEEKKMGTTMTFVCFHSEGITVAHIGDSRVYQLRPATKNEPARIVFQTRDHSLVNDLIKIGEITEEEAKNHPQKNVITRAMQPCQSHRAKADIAHLTDIQPGDYFYMCSDGMLEQTTDENLLFIVTNPKSSDNEKIEMLRNVTEENKDNHTAHLIYIDKVEGRISFAPQQSSEPQGVLINPQPEKPKKNKSLLLIALAAVIAVLAIAASFFMPSSTEAEKEEKDSVKVEKKVVNPVSPKAVEEANDTTKKDSGKVETPEKTVSAKEETTEQPPTPKQNVNNKVNDFLKKQSKPTEQKKPQAINVKNPDKK